MSQQLLTISQLAKYVGVTVRAVRHYHALGLLPEPSRDDSGYRRYGAEAVIALTRIKTLANAGVPLLQIETLIELSADDFKAAITSIKADITERVAQLEETKQRLDALQSGDRMFVTEVIADYLKYLQQIGLSEATVAYERSAWILISALHPRYADSWATEKKAMIARPGIASLYRQLDEARNWPINDPRIAELARKVVRMLARRDTLQMDGQDELTADIQSLSLIDQFSTDNASPSLQQLGDTIGELLKNK
jgi:DNA-binding transcriptional MerR regulator